VQEAPDWVIVGLDRALTYDKLATAALALERGAGFIGSNPDTSFPTEQGLVPGAGAIQAALIATTGKQPIIIGKPKPLMLEIAMHQLGGTVEDTAMLGDRLDTDIAAGQALQMATILVLTGVSKREELADSPCHPTLVVENLGQFMEEWDVGAGRQ
jgi:4-nitrophenyl phosphatase